MTEEVVYRSAEGAAAVERQYRKVLQDWSVPSSQEIIATSQGPTFIVSCGPEDGPRVLMLHGSQANSASWMFDVPVWAQKFRLHAVDMIGEPGLSEKVRPDLTGEAHARWLDEVLRGLGLRKTALIGASLGGWLALDYAAKRPDAVTAMALLCPAGIGPQKNFLLKAAPLLLLGSWGRRKMLQLVLGPAPAEVPKPMQPFTELNKLISRFVRPRIVSIPILSEEELRGLDMPILAIMGGRDVLLDTQTARSRLERLVPHAQICYKQDGYHFLPGQAPRIMEFLERHLMD